jgi:hypothetical protein
MRSYDHDAFASVVTKTPPEVWLGNDKNVMLMVDGSIGLFTYEYPGVYSGHWFFKVHGRKALDLAKEMLDHFFTNYPAKALRGLTPVDKKAARWAARQIGMTSYGILSFPNDEDHELFCMTKEDFYERHF